MVETKPEPPEESPHHSSWLSASKTSKTFKNKQLSDLWGTVHCCGYGRYPILCVPWITERHTEVPCQVPTSMLSPSRYHSSEMYLDTRCDYMLLSMRGWQLAIGSKFRPSLKPKGGSSVVLFTPTATCFESSPSSSISLLWQCHVSVVHVAHY